MDALGLDLPPLDATTRKLVKSVFERTQTDITGRNNHSICASNNFARGPILLHSHVPVDQLPVIAQLRGCALPDDFAFFQHVMTIGQPHQRTDVFVDDQQR